MILKLITISNIKVNFSLSMDRSISCNSYIRNRDYIIHDFILIFCSFIYLFYDLDYTI